MKLKREVRKGPFGIFQKRSIGPNHFLTYILNIQRTKHKIILVLSAKVLRP